MRSRTARVNAPWPLHPDLISFNNLSSNLDPSKDPAETSVATKLDEAIAMNRRCDLQLMITAKDGSDVCPAPGGSSSAMTLFGTCARLSTSTS